LNEWLDPRSIWNGAHLKTRNPQVAQFLGEIYHNAGDRMNNFVQSGTAPALTNEIPLAAAVLNNNNTIEQLRSEWSGSLPSRTNSVAYRDTLWNLAWEQYRDSLANRGDLSAPNLFLNRGRLLVSQGKPEHAIAEFKNALLLAEHSTYSVVRQETVTHTLRSIGVAYWNMHDYRDALTWYLRAQEMQRKSGQPWVPTLDQETERLKGLANAHP
jgi:tetratricopeptide (TPR) repeat protein